MSVQRLLSLWEAEGTRVWKQASSESRADVVSRLARLAVRAVRGSGNEGEENEQTETSASER